MTAILGISAFYHDSAAALLVDGNIVAAAQEERFTRKKHDHEFPRKAVEYCLLQANLRPEDLDVVSFYDKPLLKFDRLLETYLAYAPSGFRSFVRAMPLWMGEKLFVPREIDRALGRKANRRLVFTLHHESHAASAFFPSPFEEAAILTIDGVGEWATAACGAGSGNRLKLTHQLTFPHSVGLLYSAFTYYCGFRVNSGEYKLMGLAPYGAPVYADLILERILDLKEDGSFRMNMDYFNYCQGLTMTSRKFHRLFGREPRRPEAALTQMDMDLAASVQTVTEEIMLRMSRHVHKETRLKNLCLAGGVALNCVGNGRILREGPFERIWIQPAAGDAGGALGAALYVWHQLMKQPREASTSDCQRGSFLGPEFEASQIEEFLKAQGAVFRKLKSQDDLCRETACLLAEGAVVGWMQGRMEFGPRALGARSILGDARNPEMQKKMNLKIKFRESFRPFAPAVAAEQASEWFDLETGQDSPYMLFVTPVRDARRLSLNGEERELTGLDRLKLTRSEIPAVTHVDYSARVQTVDRDRNPLFHNLLCEFEKLTGCSVLINTSFNIRGEPIVCTPQDAYRCFLGTNMDAVAIGPFLLLRKEQKAREIDAEQYRSSFEPD